MKFVAAPAKIAGHFAAQKREHFVKLVGGLHARVNRDFDFRFHGAGFFEKAERESRADSKCILAVDAALWKVQLHFLPRGARTRNVGEIDRLRQDMALGFLRLADYEKRKRWPNLLLIAQFEFGKHRLLGKN